MWITRQPETYMYLVKVGHRLDNFASSWICHYMSDPICGLAVKQVFSSMLWTKTEYIINSLKWEIAVCATNWVMLWLCSSRTQWPIEPYSCLLLDDQKILNCALKYSTGLPKFHFRSTGLHSNVSLSTV